VRLLKLQLIEGQYSNYVNWFAFPADEPEVWLSAIGFGWMVNALADKRSVME
jgi:hypothetical protein